MFTCWDSSQVLLELDLYQVACSKGNQITSQIVFKIIGRPMHFLVGLVFLSVTYWNRQTSFSSGCRVIVAQLSLGPLRGEAPPSLQREREVRSEENKKWVTGTSCLMPWAGASPPARQWQQLLHSAQSWMCKQTNTPTWECLRPWSSGIKKQEMFITYITEVGSLLVFF